MIDGNDELTLAYLIDPSFELVNSAGKPLTGGWINVYVHGTRNKYYCCSDFDGTLHPFDIPLDSLGSNIVLASPQFTYDVYVYNRYGTLVMSRYNVSPVGVDEVSVSGINSISSSDGTVVVSQSGDDFDLSVPDITAVSGLVEDVAELNTAVTAIQEELEDLSGAVSGKKDKQEPYSFSETARYTVSSLSQNADGKVTVNSTKSVGSEYTIVHAGTTSNKFAKIAEFSCYSGFSYVGSGFTNLVISVSDADGARQAMISVGLTQAANGNHNFAAPLRFYVSLDDRSTFELKEVYLFSDTPWGENQVQSTISLWAEFTSLSQKMWTFKAENNYSIGGTGSDPKANVWSFANGKVYPTSALPTGGWRIVSRGPEFSQKTPDWNAAYGTRSYIANKPNLDVYVTEEELASALSGVVTEVATDDTLRGDGSSGNPLGIAMPITASQQGSSATFGADGIVLQSPAGSAVIDVEAVSGWNSLQEQIYEVSATASASQVQSDWTETDTDSKAYIRNKPEEKDLVAGDGIDITVSGTSVIISSDNPAVTGYATEIELATVSGALQLEIETVSANPRVKVIENEVDRWSDVVAAMNGVSSGKYDYVVMKYTSNGTDLYAPLVKYEAGSAAYFVCPDHVTDSVYGYGDRRVTEVFIINSSDMWVDRKVRPFQGKLIGRGNVSITVQGEDYIVSGTGGSFEQVNADWNAVSGAAEILNKPEVVGVSAGSGIDITETASGIVISCTVTGGPGGSYTAGDYIDITNDTISVTGITDLVAGNAITITSSGASAIISSTGEAQVQSDWDVTDSSSKAYIRNKPQIPEAQVQSDWAEESPYNVAYIRNKPEIHTYTGASGISISDDTVALDNPLGLVAGDNVDITVSGVSAIISCTVSGGSDVQITPIVSSGTKIAEFTVDGVSGELYAPQGGSSYTAGDNIDITNDVISVTGTGELLAGANITIAPSGSNYVISSTGGGGAATLPVSGSEGIYRAIYDTDMVDLQTTDSGRRWAYTTLSPSEARFGQFNNAGYDKFVRIQPDTISLTETDGTSVTIDRTSVNNWNTAILSVQVASAVVVQTLPASPVSSVLYLIPEA